ncbi:MAG: hypothetical protein O2855_07530 [Planctomycetota bacterium]|nr:hypothetical protein [Planctomycetota bacterium]
MTRNSGTRAGAVAIVLGAATCGVLLAGGCAEEKVVYKYRSPLLAAHGSLPDEDPRMPDGTKIVYIDKPIADWRREQAELEAAERSGAANGTATPGVDDGTEEVEGPRVTLKTGAIQLHNDTHEWLLTNLSTCFRNREWELLWRQCLAPESRRRWEGERGGTTEFVEWCETSRTDLMEFLNRAGHGLHGGDVLLQVTAPGVTCVRFSPQISTLFRISAVAMAHVDGQWKLMDIQWNQDYADPRTGSAPARSRGGASAAPRGGTRGGTL